MRLEGLLAIAGTAGLVALLIVLYAASKAYQRRQKRLDREAVAQAHARWADQAAEAERVAEEERRIAEADETWWERDDRLFPQTPLGQWLAGSTEGWLRSSTAEAIEAVRDIADRYQAARLAVYEQRSCEIGGFASPAEREADRQLAACHRDFAELKRKVDRPAVAAVDSTYEWTAEDQAEFDALCAQDVTS